MKKKRLIGIVAIIAILAIAIKLSVTIFIEPWVGKKIQSSLNEKNTGYLVKIEKVHFTMMSREVKLKNITIQSDSEPAFNISSEGAIASVKIKGIHIFKALFRKEIIIKDLIINHAGFKGKIPFPGKEKSPIVSNLTIRIGRIQINEIDVDISNISDAQSLFIKQGALNLYDIRVEKLDTLSMGNISQIDGKAEETVTVTADSLYTFDVKGIRFDTLSKVLAVDTFNVHPNYSPKEFAARHEFQTDRFEGNLSNLNVHNISIADLLKSGNLRSSYVQIGKMDLNVHRDKRKEFNHTIKPSFQEVIYSFPGIIHIDSIGIETGNISYSEFAEEAIEAGILDFLSLNAKIYNIYNDTVYKTESVFLELKAKALLMGTGMLSIHLKAKLYDNRNTFSVIGKLAEFEVNELNPFIEKNAFIYIWSGYISSMEFDFIADNSISKGKLIMIYNSLNIELKNKQNAGAPGIKERLISFVANWKIIDSNPVEGKEIRVGSIKFERDPERFLFNYAAKSILSGVKTSIL